MLLLSYIISLLFVFIVYKYLDNLEKIDCKCALTDNRKYIMYYLLTNVIINTFLFLVHSFFSKKINVSKIGIIMYGVVYGLMFIASFVFAIYTYQYLHKLRKDNCECSESIIRDMYYYYLIVIISLTICSVLLIIPIGISLRKTQLTRVKSIKYKKSIKNKKLGKYKKSRR